MKRIGFYCSILLMLAACNGKHFISDEGYRERVETDFLQKKALFGEHAKELYAVFDKPMSQEEREALTFLYAYSTISDIAYWGAVGREYSGRRVPPFCIARQGEQ